MTRLPGRCTACLLRGGPRLALGKLLGADSTPELPVEDVYRDLTKRKAINVFDCLTKLVRVESRSSHLIGVVFESFVHAKRAPEGRPSWPPETLSSAAMSSTACRTRS